MSLRILPLEPINIITTTQNQPHNPQDPSQIQSTKHQILAMESMASPIITSTSTNNNSNSRNTTTTTPSRYENQKRRDWNTFCQYLRNHRPPLSAEVCSGAHVLEFLHYLDQFGKTKVHNPACPFFGLPNPPAPCPCPLRQAWGSLDALIGRLRAAYEENGGTPETNPFGARAVRLYLHDVREFQAKARGVSYDKKRKRHKQNHITNAPPATAT